MQQANNPPYRWLGGGRSQLGFRRELAAQRHEVGGGEGVDARRGFLLAAAALGARRHQQRAAPSRAVLLVLSSEGVTRTVDDFILLVLPRRRGVSGGGDAAGLGTALASGRGRGACWRPREDTRGLHDALGRRSCSCRGTRRAC
jgi:hypothetical protein